MGSFALEADRPLIEAPAFGFKGSRRRRQLPVGAVVAEGGLGSGEWRGRGIKWVVTSEGNMAWIILPELGFFSDELAIIAITSRFTAVLRISMCKLANEKEQDYWIVSETWPMLNYKALRLPTVERVK